MRLIACTMPLIIKSQPRKTTTATDDMAGKIRARMPARIIRPLCIRYQCECRFIFSRIASRITWAADSTDIDMPFTVMSKADKMLPAISTELDPGSYWAEVQLGIVELDVNFGLREPKGS